jgi:DNA-binding LacI/PurR family transcriptional regulator
MAFGDFRIESFHIKPTILKTHPFLVGRKGAERLVQMIRDKSLSIEPHQIIIPMEILEGNSVLDQRQNAKQ